MSDAPQPSLGVVASGPPDLGDEAADWLARQLRERVGAPLVPVSALEQALDRVGASFAELGEAPPDPADLLARSRKRLFPPGRVKAVHRWLRALGGPEADPDDDRHASALLELLRRPDPLGPAGARHPVLLAVLQASLEAAQGVPELRRLLARVAGSSWPASAPDPATDPDPLGPHLRVLRWIPVRVPAVDLLAPLRAERARAGSRARAAAARDERQLPLLDAAARPVAPSVHLPRAAREAAADALSEWLAASSPAEEAATLARTLRDRLRGGPGDEAAVAALLRASALDLLERSSAAELIRIEAALLAGPHEVDPLLDYGDYLARALRNDEAVRAYHAARAVAPPADRARIDDRIAAREERLAGPAPRRRREPPDQLILKW